VTLQQPDGDPLNNNVGVHSAPCCSCYSYWQHHILGRIVCNI